MRIVDLIDKKKRNGCHSKEEINFIVDSMMNGSAPDYQISAWLMAVYFKGMSEEETSILTSEIIKSGSVIDLSKISLNVLDKHSTGGVGDKVTLTLIPLLAACNIPVAKLSGKGLGHTGGTIDKLESIPGLTTKLSIEELIKQVKEINVAIASQTQNLTPADGKLYALRDVTATVDSMPLIASSLVSKKVASGSNHIMLDVKYGSGAFVKTPQEAVVLSKLMVNIGKHLKRHITAVVTSMEEPLGRAIGNSIEVKEAIDFLKGKTEGDLTDLTYSFGVLALKQFNFAKTDEEAIKILKEAISSGRAANKFKELIKAQGGNPDVVDNFDLFEQPKFKIEVKSNQNAYVSKIDAYKIAYGCKILGAGREKKSDNIDYSVGIFLNKKSLEHVNPDEVLYTIYSNDVQKAKIAQSYCDSAFEYSSQKPQKHNMIYEIIQ